MKKLIVVTVAAIALIANMQAQNKKWSLKECIDYAILHNIEVKQSQNWIKSLKVERNTLKSSFLPNLNVGASQRFSFGRALNQDNTKFFILCQYRNASFYRIQNKCIHFSK